MARRRFGADLTAVVWRTATVDGTADLLQLGRSVGGITAWDSETAGTQVTDLTDPLGAALAGGVIAAGPNGLIDFFGPATTPETVALWLSTGLGQRQLITASDIAGQVVAVAGAVGQAATDIAGLDARLDALETKPFRVSADFTFGEAAPGTIGGHRWYNRTGRTLTILGVQPSATVAPQGGATGLRCDVNRNDTTIFGTQSARPTVPVGQTAGAFAAGHTVTTLPDGDYLTVDIDDAGTTTPGANIGVQVWLAG